MDKDNKDRKPETDMHVSHRRADAALTVISITFAAAFIGIGAYVAIWHIVLPLLGVNQC